MADTKMTWEQAVRMCMTDPAMAQLAQSAYFMQPLAAGQAYHASGEFAAVKRMLPAKPGRALDLGAGNGILSYALAREGWDVTAVEPDPSALIGAGAIRALAAESGTPITVIEAFGEAIPLEAAGFDLVVARQVLHHAADLPGFCREMARLSRPGAVIVTLRDHVISGPDQLAPFLAQHPLHRYYGGENAFTLEQYRSALLAAGLTVQSEMRSFQSVVNFDPMTQAEVLDRAYDADWFCSALMHTNFPHVFLQRRSGRSKSCMTLSFTEKRDMTETTFVLIKVAVGSRCNSTDEMKSFICLCHFNKSIVPAMSIGPRLIKASAASSVKMNFEIACQNKIDGLRPT